MGFLLLPDAGNTFKDAEGEGVCVCVSKKVNTHLYHNKNRAKSLTQILVSLRAVGI